MTRRILRSIIAAAAVASTAAVAAAGQTAPWTPSRLPDGQLDIRGHWIRDAGGGGHSAEEGRDPAVLTGSWTSGDTGLATRLAEHTASGMGAIPTPTSFRGGSTRKIRS